MERFGRTLILLSSLAILVIGVFNLRVYAETRVAEEEKETLFTIEDINEAHDFIIEVPSDYSSLILTIGSDRDTFGGSVSYYVLNENGDTISSEGVALYASDAFSKTTTQNISLGEKGRYTVRVVSAAKLNPNYYDPETNVITEPIYIKYSLVLPDFYEYNNTYETATPIVQDEVMMFNLTGREDVDIFRFETKKANETVSLSITNDGMRFDTKISVDVFDEGYTRIYEHGVSSYASYAFSSDWEDSFVIETPGIYYLRIRSAYLANPYYYKKGGTLHPLQLKVSAGAEDGEIIDDSTVYNLFDKTEILASDSDTLIVNKFLEALEGMGERQKTTSLNQEEIANFIEYCVQKRGSKTGNVVNGSIQISSDLFDGVESEMTILQDLLLKEAETQMIKLNRKLDQAVEVELNNQSGDVNLVLDTSLKTIDVDKISIKGAGFALTIDSVGLEANLNDDLIISIEHQPVVYENVEAGVLSAESEKGILSMGSLYNNHLTGAPMTDKLQITFKYLEEEEEKLVTKLTVGFDSVSAESEYNSVFIERNNGNVEALGGKINKKTGKLEIKTDEAGTYYVMENRKSFSDIANLDEGTKKAIEVLAAKGIINGKSEIGFDPNGTITRAEFAKIIVRALYLTDMSAPNTFKDVKETAWYKPYVASSKSVGLINGYTDGTFQPDNVITKQEMVKICAASMYEQKGYQYPENIEIYLSRYSDIIAVWVQPYLALAEREGIITGEASGLFGGEKGTTRAAAAVMLYKLFNRL